jgi:hypothetical protein
MLAGCGGGGNVASTPTPIGSSETTVYAISTKRDIGAELPPTPATTPGTYDTFAVRNLRLAGDSQSATNNLDAGQVKVIVGSDHQTYTIVLGQNVIPGLSAPENSLSYTIDDPGYNHIVTETTKWSDGTSRVSTQAQTGDVIRQPNANSAITASDFWARTANEKRYVSLGLWRLIDTPSQNRGEVYFIYGDRTPPGSIPASGTATYITNNKIGDFLEYATIAWYDVDIDIKLTADFAKRSMNANMALAFQDDFIKAVARPSLSGTGPIASTGSFAIPLSGVMDSTAANSDPVSGSISGALFGPDASQLGATFMLLHDGERPITGAFIGIKQ